MAAAGHGIGGGQFGEGEADHDIDQAGQGKSERGRALSRADDQAQGHIYIGPDVGIAPHERSPDRDIASQLELLGLGDGRGRGFGSFHMLLFLSDLWLSWLLSGHTGNS